MYYKMLANSVAFFLIYHFCLIQAETYYFNINKTTNQYRITQRYNQQPSAYGNYPSNLVKGELQNNTLRKNTIKSLHSQTHTLLDSEWDYNWHNVTRTKLPASIYKFYYNLVEHNENNYIRILFNKMPLNSTLLQFNLTNITTDSNNIESFSEVDLHLYLTIDKKYFQKSLILRLYEINLEHYNESTLINPDSHKLLNVIYILQADSGWQVFKLTNSLKKALKQFQKELVLLVTISKPNDESFTLFHDVNNSTTRSFLVWKIQSDKKEPTSVDALSYQSSACSKHDLYIDFGKLNWMKFIIAPSGYNASNCYGKCFKDSQNLPNHIKVSSFNVEFKRKPLCCVPTKYLSLPIMYYDSNGNVVIKNYDDMAIAGCGCR